MKKRIQNFNIFKAQTTNLNFNFSWNHFPQTRLFSYFSLTFYSLFQVFILFIRFISIRLSYFTPVFEKSPQKSNGNFKENFHYFNFIHFQISHGNEMNEVKLLFYPILLLFLAWFLLFIFDPKFSEIRENISRLKNF